ncbi:hypothetical protein [Kordiimonas sp.]|uniref:hypothetical protein n=1 Tax=Kordiimonas sp. TaxID=1970157 RepID=UPI003A8FB2EE
MGTFFKTLKLGMVAVAALVGISAASTAQVLTVDDERVEREAAAYKDFNLQTNELRQSILQRRQMVTRGGAIEQQLADLEKRKAIIGNDKYEEEKKKLEQTYVRFQQELAQLEYVFDQLRQEAMVQVERARQPVIRSLLAERNAQVIMMKRLLLGSAAGIDVTTQFIEKLDAELPNVTLNLPKAGDAPAAEQPAQQ